MRSAQQRIGALFSALPIKHKLMVIMMSITTAALLLAGTGIVVVDRFLFYEYVQRDLFTMTRIIADNTTAALSFNDEQSAAETLAALRARPHVVTACVYREDLTILARYVRAGSTAGCVPVTAFTGEEIAEDHITAVEPIVLQNRRIGTLALLYDLGRVSERTRLFGAIVIIMAALSILVAFLLSSRLRAVVSTPIAQLAAVATSVAETKDYSIRVQRHTSDELGLLGDAFNQMLAGIQLRDDNLRQALLDVQKSNERLERSNEDLERFAFIASHDLQEPLRMITVYSQLLVRQYSGGVDNQGAMFVGNIVGGTKRMRDLLADLLAYTDITARTDRPLEKVDLNLVLEAVRENLKMTMEDNQVIMMVDRLPSITAYESHFVSLFQNLISNAIKYRGKQPPCIRISAEQVNGEVRLTVADNGIGIEPKYHTSIFKAFKRLHGPTIQGTGIGLAICQRVVERYGGRIWVESELGHGASFRFTLPRDGSPQES